MKKGCYAHKPYGYGDRHAFNEIMSNVLPVEWAGKVGIRECLCLARILSVFFATILLCGGPSHSQSSAIDPKIFSQGLVLYNENCAICHGENGEGDGRLASGFSPRPANFSMGLFKFRSTHVGEFPTPTDLAKTIRNGINGSYGRTMPAFSAFDDGELRALAEVVRAAAGAPEFGTLVEVPPRPQNVDLAAGAALFTQLNCVECHGLTGDGQGRMAATLIDTTGNQIRPANFQTGKFKGGDRPEDIWKRISIGLDGTPMPSFGRGLSGEKLWPLVDYVLSFSNGGS